MLMQGLDGSLAPRTIPRRCTREGSKREIETRRCHGRRLRVPELQERWDRKRRARLVLCIHRRSVVARERREGDRRKATSAPIRTRLPAGHVDCMHRHVRICRGERCAKDTHACIKPRYGRRAAVRNNGSRTMHRHRETKRLMRARADTDLTHQLLLTMKRLIINFREAASAWRMKIVYQAVAESHRNFLFAT